MSSLFAVLCTVALAAGVLTPQGVLAQGSPAWQLFAPRAAPPPFYAPAAIAVAPDGAVYVADTGDHRVKKFSAAGKLLATWGEDVDRPGSLYFFGPYDIAVDSRGYVYVVDAAPLGIVKIAPSGRVVTTRWAAHVFHFPARVAVGPGDTVVVVDGGPNGGKIVRLTSAGKVLSRWALYRGAYRLSVGPVTVDSHGNVIVFVSGAIPCGVPHVDCAPARFIQKRSPRGALLAEWDFQPLATDLYGLAVAQNGDVLVAVTGVVARVTFGHRSFRAMMGVAGCATPRQTIAPSVAVDRNGTIYIADGYYDTLQKLDPTGQRQTALWGGCRPAHTDAFESVAVSQSGNVFVAESNGVIRKYSPSGTSLAVWKTLAPDGTPEGIAVDVHGDVYVTDAIAGVIDKLSPTGALLAVWGRNWPEPKMNQPWGITVDTDGVVYVVETNGNVVDKIAPNGTLLARWGSPGHAVGQLNSPRGITLDGHGHIYVADSYNGRILEYSKTGTLLRHWGGANWSGNKYFSDHAIAVVSDGFYVAVTAGGLVQHYSFAGKLLQSWGRDGGEDGQGAGRRQFNSPQGLALDSRRGYLYVADSDNRRIERLSLRENSR